MPTLSLAEQFRNKVGDPGTVFSADEIDTYFANAEAAYPNGSNALWLAHAVVEGYEDLLGSANKLASYTQNASSESLGQIPANIRAALQLWQDKLDDLAEAEAGGGIRFGSFGGRGTPPTRIRDFPDA